MYKIVRYYYPKNRNANWEDPGVKRPRMIKMCLTVEEAQAHCQDPTTRKEGEYFDGYVET